MDFLANVRGPAPPPVEGIRPGSYRPRSTTAVPPAADPLNGVDVEECDVQRRTADPLAHFPQPAAQLSV